MFKKIMKFLLKHDPPEDAEDISMYLFTPKSKDTNKRYYLKLVPCNKLGCFPEFGAMEEKEFQTFMNKSSSGEFATTQDSKPPDRNQLEQLLSDIKNDRHKKLMN